MCTKSQKDGQTHKNTGIRRAIFLKRSARRATWVHCKPNLAVSDSGRIKVLNWGLSPHGDQTNLDYTAEAKNLWCSKFTDTHCDVIQIHTVMWCADQTIPKYAAPTWWSPFDTMKKIYQSNLSWICVFHTDFIRIGQGCNGGSNRVKPRPAKTQKDLLYGSKTLGTFVQIFNCQDRL